MFKVALATTVCYDKSCINYKKLEIKTLQFPNNEVFIYDTFGVNIKIGICNSKTNHFFYANFINTRMFFELIVYYERARNFLKILVKINFLNFMALNEVIWEN
jgi:hypothetical protein